MGSRNKGFYFEPYVSDWSKQLGFAISYNKDSKGFSVWIALIFFGLYVGYERNESGELDE
jgi:hypothetical protein